MSDHQAGDINASIAGNVTGQVAVGHDIHQSSVISTGPVTEADLEQLRTLFADARAVLAAQVDEADHAAAAERLDELEEAVTAGEPDLTTMAYVKAWFARRLPHLAGLVTSILVNPIVGKVVSSAGDAVAKEFQHLLV